MRTEVEREIRNTPDVLPKGIPDGWVQILPDQEYKDGDLYWIYQPGEWVDLNQPDTLEKRVVYKGQIVIRRQDPAASDPPFRRLGQRPKSNPFRKAQLG